MRKFALVCLFIFAIFQIYENIPHQVNITSSEVAAAVENQERAIVIIVYASDVDENHGRVVESIAKQNYTNNRVVFIDDNAGEEGTIYSRKMVQKYQLYEKFNFLHNRHKEGLLSHLYYLLNSFEDNEILLILRADTALAHPDVLAELNFCYNDSNIEVTICQTVSYPTYKTNEFSSKLKSVNYPLAAFSMYARLAKKVPLNSLLDKGVFSANYQEERLIYPIMEIAKGHIFNINKVLIIENLDKETFKQEIDIHSLFQEAKTLAKNINSSSITDESRVTLVIFSEDRPMQLSCELKQIQKMLSNIEKITVCYKATTKSFDEGYEKVKEIYPLIDMQRTPKNLPFNNSLSHAISKAPSKYIILASDTLLLKEKIELKSSIELLEDTGAFHLSFTLDPRNNTSLLFIKSRDDHYLYTSSSIESLSHIQGGQMTLFRKSDLKNGGGKLLSYLLGDPKGKLPKEGLVGSCYKIAPAVKTKIAHIKGKDNASYPLYSQEELNNRFLSGESIDSSTISHRSKSTEVEYYPHFIKESL